MYAHVVLGGTFDHLHAGHRDLLEMAFAKGKKVSLGLTKASMNRGKTLASQIQPYRQREKEILKFANSREISIIPIHNIYGKTLVDPTLDAILVTPHTHAGAQKINAERLRLGLPALPIEMCELRHDDAGEILCSSNIRLGITDREGHLAKVMLAHDLTINEAARTQLHRPHGKAIGANKLRERQTPLIVVGDIATRYCVTNQVPFTAAYIDGISKHFSVKFEVTSPYTKEALDLKNDPGTIAPSAVDHILEHFGQRRNQIFQIHGEEDLLAIAATLLLPLGTRVIYGYPFQPESLRCITVQEKVKQKFQRILDL